MGFGSRERRRRTVLGRTRAGVPRRRRHARASSCAVRHPRADRARPRQPQRHDRLLGRGRLPRDEHAADSGHPATHGSTHFLEHLLFKGTETRSALDIAVSLDAVGGEHNAVTAKEYTCYYAKVQDRDLPMAVEVLADMFTSSALDPRSPRASGGSSSKSCDGRDDPADVANERSRACWAPFRLPHRRSTPPPPTRRDVVAKAAQNHGCATLPKRMRGGLTNDVPRRSAYGRASMRRRSLDEAGARIRRPIADARDVSTYHRSSSSRAREQVNLLPACPGSSHRRTTRGAQLK